MNPEGFALLLSFMVLKRFNSEVYCFGVKMIRFRACFGHRVQAGERGFTLKRVRDMIRTHSHYT